MNTLLFYFFLALGISFLCSLLESIILSVTPSFAAVAVKSGSSSSRILERMKENINKDDLMDLYMKLTDYIKKDYSLGNNS